MSPLLCAITTSVSTVSHALGQPGISSESSPSSSRAPFLPSARMGAREDVIAIAPAPPSSGPKSRVSLGARILGSRFFDGSINIWDRNLKQIGKEEDNEERTCVPRAPTSSNDDLPSMLLSNRSGKRVLSRRARSFRLHRPADDSPSTSRSTPQAADESMASEDATHDLVSTNDPSSVALNPPSFDIDHQRKQRLAKLRRHLGEDIPPELVLFSEIPVSPSPRPAPLDVIKEENSRTSDDYSVLSQSRPSSPPEVEEDTLTRGPWKPHLEHDTGILGDGEPQVAYEYGWTDREVLSERSRTLNVKRARKMAQVFGSDPPRGLFIVDHTDDITPDGFRDSVSEDVLSDTTPHNDSMVSIVFSDTSSTAGQEEPTSELDSTPATPPAPPFATLSRASSMSLLSRTLPSQLHSRTPSLDGMALFNERRRRAAKLTHFFGVNYQMLQPSLPTTRLPTVGEHPAPSEERSLTLDVKVSAPSRFWMLGNSAVRDVEVTDVIDRLRTLKAS